MPQPEWGQVVPVQRMRISALERSSGILLQLLSLTVQTRGLSSTTGTACCIDSPHERRLEALCLLT